ncbi:MAG: 5-methyltetrahydropteroyltriglutamate--homocysteine S-methyltransferase [Pseudomonadota bacterium]|nr:5-methyltetrahydropteroyltriglutamate--homocysteine S-methyltransferase [Pseudomonadota bacterium]
MGVDKGLPICRADHIGSLLRPNSLRLAYKAYAAGELQAEEFIERQDKAITDAIRMQEDAGLGVVTDGEFRRRSWFAGFVDRVEGLVHKDTKFRFIEGEKALVAVPVPHVGSKIKRVSGIATDEFIFVQKIAARPIKITIPAPSVIHFFRGPDGIERAAYPEDDLYWEDLIHVYKEEIRELGGLGLSYLQFDEVPIALFCDPNVRVRLNEWGWDWHSLFDQYIKISNKILDSRPSTMRVGMHLCRGNFRGKWIGAGGYDDIAERLFNEVNVDQFLLEYDTDRAGNFSPLQHMPRQKAAVLGMISSKTAEMEDENVLHRRLEEASRYISMDRLAISPQCGFGTTVGGAPMSEDDQRRKLELVGRVAEKAWR